MGLCTTLLYRPKTGNPQVTDDGIVLWLREDWSMVRIAAVTYSFKNWSPRVNAGGSTFSDLGDKSTFNIRRASLTTEDVAIHGISKVFKCRTGKQ